jgi:hypothetical protein
VTSDVEYEHSKVQQARCIVLVSARFILHACTLHDLRRGSCHDVRAHPSINCDLCVAEIVRRQLTRPFAGSPAKEEAVIRERFAPTLPA